MGGPFLALLCRCQFSGCVSPHVAPGPAASNKKPRPELGCWPGAKDHATRTNKPCSHVPAQVSSDNKVQLVLSDWEGRQAVIAVVSPLKPDERSVRRGPSGVVINAAVSAIELHDGKVRACWNGGRKAKRQRTNCEEDFLHSPKPLCCTLLPSPRADLERPEGL